jgi:glycosyltransferase involved in cell wall biosynthesis
MKIMNVVPDIGEEANGVTPVIQALSKWLVKLGNDVGLGTIKAAGDFQEVDVQIGKKWSILSRFEISTELAGKVSRASHDYDIVHCHSLWSMINVACGYVVPGKRAKLVTSPHGTLSQHAMKRTSFLKSILWPFQRRLLEKSDLLHATSEEEIADIRRFGFRAPIALIPNGTNIPAVLAKRRSEGPRTLLFLSRIHPTKGLEQLLEAWQKVSDRHPDWCLVIAGVGTDEYEGQIKLLATKLKLERIVFCGPLYGEAKAQAYVDADLFILPTYTENFGMVVAEALAHGCPAIVGTGAPWAGLVDHDCGWWEDNDAASLVKVLDLALISSPERLQKMGRNGRSWMNQDYNWERLSEKFDISYRWLLGKADRPEWIKEL